jgi:hypothetical protein
MPRNEIDYSKTIIYKIVCNDLTVTDCYVGSTTDFKTRKAAHKSMCNNKNSKNYNFKVYKMIRDNGGWLNWVMLQIELYLCKDSNEARARERYWYENMNAKLNSCIPIKTKEEFVYDKKMYDSKYYDENKNHKKEYYIQNKGHIKEYNAKYRDENKDHIKEYKSKHYDENKDHIKEYYIQNKEKILIKGIQEIQCPSCNCIIKKCSLNMHNKSAKHIKNKNDEIKDIVIR